MTGAMSIEQVLALLIALAVVPVPLVNALIAGLKTVLPGFNSRYLPVASITFGMGASLGLAILAGSDTQMLRLALGAGFISGLMAAGLFQYGKAQQEIAIRG